MRAGGAVQINVGDAVQVIGSGEEAGIRRVIPRRKRQAAEAGGGKRNDVDAVAVVVERDLIDESRADGVGGVDNGAVRRVAEGVAHGGDVVSAPLAIRKVLGNLFGDEVAEDRELTREVVIDPDHFLFEICRCAGSAEEFIAVGGLGEDAGVNQGGRVRIDHAAWNFVSREGLTLNDTCRGNAARAVGKKDARRDLGGRRDIDNGPNGAEVSIVGSGIRHQLAAGRSALNQSAPFHVVEKEGALFVGVVEVAECNGAADVEAEDVKTQLRNWIGSRVEEVARVEGVVAVEFPSRSVQRAGAGLENHRHCASGREAVIRAVVGSKSTKLRDSVG